MSPILALSIGFGLLFIISICKAACECARINEADHTPPPPRRRLTLPPPPRRRRAAGLLRLNPHLFL